MPQIGEPFDCLSIPIHFEKVELNDPSTGKAKLDENGEVIYYCGFSIGGGIDQDHKLSPQKYPDNGIYVTTIKPDGPAARTDLRVNDKILQVNGRDFTLMTHKKAVEYIKKAKKLDIKCCRPKQQCCIPVDPCAGAYGNPYGYPSQSQYPSPYGYGGLY
ncbi:unnamed protein product [Brachionus calyciflorus]|uniref:PDZ domain-containing protein n=2 Tax=Brachionus calyciflorus TaxID=104777 RepID=A0A813MXY3_9BILA|nr:unnamed protein product [Brachionus calyciflorus]